jgi:hypothetical protein
MYQAVQIMKTLNVTGVIVAMTLIALAGITMVASTPSLLLVQSASATDDVMTTTPSVGGGGGGEQEAVSSTTTNTTNNNVSNALLGSLFMIVEFGTANVNPINETYIEVSTVNKVTIIPPKATATTTINGTETANVTVNILPNGLALSKGQTLIMTEGDDDDGAAEQENATSAAVDISSMNPDGTGAGTGVVFFSTNSTGQLAFLDNMVGISQSEFSPEGGTIRTWEWKGGTLPFETGAGAAPTEEPSPLTDTTTTTTTNATATTADDTTAATPAPAPEQGEGVEGEEEQQQRQATIAPNPLFE